MSGREGRKVASFGDGVRIHALASATEHDVWCLLGLLLLPEQCHSAQGRITGAHLFQELWSQSKVSTGVQTQNILQNPKCRASHLRRPTASSSSFFIRCSVFILPEPFPWKRWDSCRKACGYKTHMNIRNARPGHQKHTHPL